MRRSLLFALLAVLFALCGPARAQFCPGVSPWVFDDVLASDPFCGYITWMAENGVSLGCQVIDANHRLYCPSDNVSRKQMAAFMNRLGNVRVEAVDTGPGLTGGPITSVGTINLATTQLLPTTACANNQIPRWNGSAWVCGTDANSGGTVTSVGSGTGLTGGPITTTGTLSIATAYQLPQSCTNGQIPKSNGAGGWTCATDNAGSGTVTSITAGNGLTGGTITTSGTIAVDTSALANYLHKQGGNAYGTTAVIGTTDNNPIEVRASGLRVMRYEPNAISPNVMGGSPANNVTPGVRGATIGGGGAEPSVTDPDYGAGAPNRVTDIYGTVGGGWGNVAGDDAGTANDSAFAAVGGGFKNTAGGAFATVSGGTFNTGASFSSVGGGSFNAASGSYATAGGGNLNSAGGNDSTVGGGEFNAAEGNWATVGGGYDNAAYGAYATVPGGALNVAQGLFSFAAGINAKALHDRSFVWGGSDTVSTESNGPGVFTVYAPTSVQMYAGVVGSGGCTLTSGASGWSCSSDRALKSDIAPVDTTSMLERVVAMPVSRWSFTSVPGVMHVGPMAQDFHAAFGLGDDDRTLAPMDVQGVALAAIQGLNAKLEAKVEAQVREIGTLRSEIAELKRAVEVLLARTSPEGRVAAR